MAAAFYIPFAPKPSPDSPEAQGSPYQPYPLLALQGSDQYHLAFAILCEKSRPFSLLETLLSALGFARDDNPFPSSGDFGFLQAKESHEWRLYFRDPQGNFLKPFAGSRFLQGLPTQLPPVSDGVHFLWPDKLTAGANAKLDIGDFQLDAAVGLPHTRILEPALQFHDGAQSPINPRLSVKLSCAALFTTSFEVMTLTIEGALATTLKVSGTALSKEDVLKTDSLLLQATARDKLSLDLVAALDFKTAANLKRLNQAWFTLDVKGRARFQFELDKLTLHADAGAKFELHVQSWLMMAASATQTITSPLFEVPLFLSENASEKAALEFTFAIEAEGAVELLHILKDATVDLDLIKNGLKTTCTNFALSEIKIPYLDFFLQDLLGPGRGFLNFITPPTLPENLPKVERLLNGVLDLSFTLQMKVGDGDKSLIRPSDSASRGVFQFRVTLGYDLRTGSLANNRLNFVLDDQEHGIDLLLFGMKLPKRGKSPQQPATKGPHGYLDLSGPALVITSFPEEEQREPIEIYVPGGFKDSIPGEEKSSRFVLTLVPFEYAEGGADNKKEKILFRVSSRGLSFAARLGKDEVHLREKPKTVHGPDSSLLPITAKALPEFKGEISRVEIMNNTIVAAVLHAELGLPACKSVQLIATARLEAPPGEPPALSASLALQSDQNISSDLDLGILCIHIDPKKLRLTLAWSKSGWNVGCLVSASLSLSRSLSELDGLDSLLDPTAICVEDLDLVHLHSTQLADLALKLEPHKDVEINLLNGFARCAFSEPSLSFTVNPGTGIVGATLFCKAASLGFSTSAPLTLSCSLKEFQLKFDLNLNKLSDSKVQFVMPSGVSIYAQISDLITFSGGVSWKREATERSFAVEGKINLFEFISGGGMLKIGVVTKENGAVVPALACFASLQVDTPLFIGIVAKELGAGFGINYRLYGMTDDATPDELLANLNKVRPDKEAGWLPVHDDGFYLSIVGTLLLGSTQGGSKVSNAYLAWLLFCIDSRLNVNAAGQVWFASSVDYLDKDDHRDRPAIAGVVVLRPRRRSLAMVMESRKNPAIEASELLSKLFSLSKVRVSLAITPEAVDYFLEEASFGINLFGFDLKATGSMRVGLMASTALVRADFMTRGALSVDLSCGWAGFAVSADITSRISYGGIIGREGLMAYGVSDFHFAATVAAFLKVCIDFGFFEVDVTFRASISVELFYGGHIAFDAKGSFGLRGQIGFEGRLCGFRLRISVDLPINEHVLDEVRNEVASFEARLNSARALHLNSADGEPSRILSGSNHHTAEQKEESWLHFSSRREDKTYHLLIPRRDAPWFCPIRKTETKAQDLDQHVVEIQVTYCVNNGPPKILQVQLPWTPKEPTHNRVDAFKMSAQRSDDHTTNIYNQDYEFVQDPRVRSTARRYWTPEDQLALASVNYALPYRFRELDELDSKTSPSEPTTTEAQATVGEHLDVLRFEACRRQALRLAQQSGGDLDSEEELMQIRATLVYEMIEDLRQAPAPTIYAQPSKDPAVQQGPIFSLGPDATIKSVSIIRSNSGKKEPVDCERVQDIPDANPTEFIELHHPRQEHVAAGETDAKADSAKRVIVKLPVYFQQPNRDLLDQAVSISHFDIYRRFPWEEEPVRIAHKVLPHMKEIRQASSTMRKLKTDDKKRQIWLHPYLSSDEFIVEGDRFKDPRIIPGVTPIYYSLRAVPCGEPELDIDVTQDALRWRDFPPVRLHIPKPDLFPRGLALVLPAAALEWKQIDSHEIGPFTLVTLDGERIEPARMRDGRRLNLSDFEIWAEVDRSTAQEGFYLSSAAFVPDHAAPRRQTSADGHAQSTPPRQTPAGKVPIEVLHLTKKQETDPPTGLYLNRAAFSQAAGHQLFIRARQPAQAKDNTIASLAHLPALLVPESATMATAQNTRVADPIRFSDALKNPVPPIQAAVRVTRELDSNSDTYRLSIRTQGLDISHGGLEVVLHDIDEPTWKRRQLCEVLEQSIFCASKRDFSDASSWRLDSSEKSTPLHIESIAAEAPQNDLTSHFFPKPEEPIRKALDKARQGLTDAAKQTVLTWAAITPALRAWGEAFRRFKISPFHLNDALVRDLDAVQRDCIHLLALGWKVTLPAAVENESIEARIAKARAACEAARAESKALISEASQLSGKASNTDRQDARAADRLSAILRRRAASADTVLRLEEATDEGSDWLPRAEAWRSLAQRIEDPLREDLPLVVSRKLKDKVARTAEGDWINTVRLLADLVASAVSALSDGTRKQRVSAFVPEANGLREFLRKLNEKKPANSSLETRPHHQAGTQDESAGRSVQPTKLADLLQPFLPIQDAIDTDNILPLFHVLERMGFSVDIAGQMGGAPHRRKELLDQVKAAAQGNDATLFRIVMLASNIRFATDHGHGDTGFDFIQVALIPNAFLLALKNKSEVLKAWFAARGISLDDDKQLDVLSSLAKRIPDQDDPAILYVRPSATERVTIPSINGFATASIVLPDRHGRRLRIEVRPVGRFEPFWAWAKDATAQTRADSTSVSYWVPPLLRQSKAAPIRVATFPHPTLLRYSYAAPRDGANALRNQLIAIRSGYAGYDLSLSFREIGAERIEASRLNALTQHIKAAGDSPPIEAPPIHVDPMEAVAPQPVRLFANERLVSYPDLAACYQYRPQVSSRYRGEKLLDAPSAAVVSDEMPPTYTSLQFSHLGLRGAVLTKKPSPSASADQSTLTYRIFLSRFIDHLTPKQQDALPPHIEYLIGSAKVPLPQLLDYGMRYQLCRGQMLQPVVYVQLIEIALPWHPSYKPDEHMPGSAQILVRDPSVQVPGVGYLPIHVQTQNECAPLFFIDLPVNFGKRSPKDEAPDDLFMRADRGSDFTQFVQINGKGA